MSSGRFKFNSDCRHLKRLWKAVPKQNYGRLNTNRGHLKGQLLRAVNSVQ